LKGTKRFGKNPIGRRLGWFGGVKRISDGTFLTGYLQGKKSEKKTYRKKMSKKKGTRKGTELTRNEVQLTPTEEGKTRGKRGESGKD